ncbi:MAG: hypothetical protein ACOYMG_26495 [Candidatus Methylumidiphilus sp.]
MDSYPSLLNSLLAGQEFMPLIGSSDRQKHRAEWREFLRELTRSRPGTPELASTFHTQWHVCHHRLRELIEDDGLLLDVAWAWLPRYAGPGLVLFRGENIDRFEVGQIGSAWTDKIETANTFATGLNAVGKGGVVLKVHAPAEAIIAGPSKHSLYLGESEFTLDTRVAIGQIA